VGRGDRAGTLVRDLRVACYLTDEAGTTSRPLRPLHVVAAENAAAREIIVITVYHEATPRELLDAVAAAERAGVQREVRQFAAA